MVAADRPGVARLLGATDVFTPGETAVALELVDEWLARGEASGYLAFVLDGSDRAARPEEVRAYACFGPTPLTEGTFDLYWIAVDPAWRRHGYGQALLEFAERDAASRGGRLLLIETSSQETYGGTVHFYERNGYPLLARIADFYKPGDDKLIFGKRL